MSNSFRAAAVLISATLFYMGGLWILPRLFVFAFHWHAVFRIPVAVKYVTGTNSFVLSPLTRPPLQGLVFARKTSLPALWSTPLTSLCPKGNQPLSTARQRAVQPPRWNGTKTGSALRRTATTPAPTVCCCPAGPSSSCASSTAGGASPTMAATCAWPETIWERP